MQDHVAFEKTFLGAEVSQHSLDKKDQLQAAVRKSSKGSAVTTAARH